MTKDLSGMHDSIIELHEEMKRDPVLQALCVKHGLPWDFAAGYEPRWYNGPAPSEVELLFFMAEPGAITPTEALHLLPAITYDEWIGRFDLRLQEHYWRANLRELCSHVWPEDTEAQMTARLAGSCTFWMSLPPGAQTDAIPRELLRYFSSKYLGRLLALFPDAVILAAGGKARDRLQTMGVAFEECWAFTRPGSNRREAHESWRVAGLAVARKLARRPATRSSQPERSLASAQSFRPGAPRPTARPPKGSRIAEGSERITVLAIGNPRRGTWARLAFSLYRTGMTVDEWRSACRRQAPDHLNHMTGYLWPDVDDGYISLD